MEHKVAVNDGGDGFELRIVAQKDYHVYGGPTKPSEYVFVRCFLLFVFVSEWVPDSVVFSVSVAVCMLSLSVCCLHMCSLSLSVVKTERWTMSFHRCGNPI